MKATAIIEGSEYIPSKKTTENKKFARTRIQKHNMTRNLIICVTEFKFLNLSTCQEGSYHEQRRTLLDEEQSAANPFGRVLRRVDRDVVLRVDHLRPIGLADHTLGRITSHDAPGRLETRPRNRYQSQNPIPTIH